MKSNYTCAAMRLAFMLLVFIASKAQSQPNFAITGFATQNGGTTGGQGGATVTANNYTDLKTYAESATTYIIKVNGTISNGSAGGQIKINSNKSIIGNGSTALLSGIGLNIASKNNIIIQNVRITLVGTSTPSSVNGGDCIVIGGTSKNIWIDHCELFSENPDVQTNIDKYDGLIDIRDQTGFITVSWCYLHDHHKGCLVGASDTDLYADRKITYHHNYFNKVKLRVPMYRGSTGHFFNNYIVGAKDASEIRNGTCVRIEKNYYEALHYSIYTPSDAAGSAQRIDNIEVSRTSRAYPANCTASIPYNYSAFLTNTTTDVKTIVPQYAGVGKIGTVAPPTSPSAFSTIQAESYTTMLGVQTETCSEGGLDVSYIENSDWIRFASVNFGTGATGVSARVASNTSGGSIKFRIDAAGGTQIGAVNIVNTGGWQTWATVTGSVSGVTGVHDLYLSFSGGTGYLFNLNHFVFTGGSARLPGSEEVAESITENEVQLSPNPAENVLHVETNQALHKDAGIVIYDNMGRQMLNSKISDSKTTIDVGSFLPGIYIFRLTNSQKIATRKFLKK